jgi:capsule polysaccharide export protein KpsE/RkpR
MLKKIVISLTVILMIILSYTSNQNRVTIAKYEIEMERLREQMNNNQNKCLNAIKKVSLNAAGEHHLDPINSELLDQLDNLANNIKTSLANTKIPESNTEVVNFRNMVHVHKKDGISYKNIYENIMVNLIYFDIQACKLAIMQNNKPGFLTAKNELLTTVQTFASNDNALIDQIENLHD